MANPVHAQLVADVELILTLDENYSNIQVTVTSGPALIYWNSRDAAVPTVAGTLASLAGHDTIPAVLCSVIARDGLAGQVSKVRLRSAGTPTVTVKGL